MKTIFFKRLISMCISFLLVFSLIPINAFAEETDFVINDGLLTEYNGTDTIVKIPDGVTSIGYNCFRRNEAIQKVIIPEGISAIQNGTFKECTNLIQVVLPESVVSIGDGAFEGCSSLRYINLPSAISSIPSSCFKECENLFSIDLPEGLKSIGYSAFLNCSLLSNVTLPEGLETIGQSAFAETAISKITIPASITKIDKYAFSGCLENGFTLPESMTEIPAGIFTAIAAKEVIIPEGITSIGDEAFSGADIEVLKLPNTLVSIGANAFSTCKFEEVIIPDSVTSIGESAFSSNTALKSVILSKNLTDIPAFIFNDCNALANIVIPEGVKYIGEKAFRDCHKNIYAVIPESVTKMEDSAFMHSFHGTKYMKIFAKDGSYAQVYADKNNIDFSPIGYSVPTNGFAIENGTLMKYYGGSPIIEIPETVSAIGAYAFDRWNGDSITVQSGDAANVTRVKIPSSVKTIGDYAFSQCGRLEDIEIAEGLKEIGEDALAGLYVNIPKSVEKISGELNIRSQYLYGYTNTYFADYCKDLDLTFNDLNKCTVKDGLVIKDGKLIRYIGIDSSVNIPSNVKTIGEDAFRYAPNLKEIIISEGVTTIEANAFRGCEYVKELILPSTIKTLGEAPFTYIDNVIFTGEMDSIKEGVFSKAKTTKITFPSGLKVIAPDSFNSSYIETIEIPEGVTDISQAFKKCYSDKATIPSTVTKMDYAFFDSNIDEVEISASVTSIGMYTFGDCYQLKKVLIPASVTSIGDYAFDGCSSNLTIYGYAGTFAEEYATANGIKFVTLYKPIVLNDDTTDFTCETADDLFVNAIQPITVNTSNGIVYTFPTNSINIATTRDNYDFATVLTTDFSQIASGDFTSDDFIAQISVPTTGLEAEVTLISFYVGNSLAGTKTNCYVLMPDGTYENTDISYTVSDSGILKANLEQGQTYVFSTKSDITLGDVNGDTNINAADALNVLKHAAKIITLDSTQFIAADVTKDTNINASDALMILKYAAKLIDSF